MHTDVRVFSATWFARHQRTLLTLLNAPVIGGEFRAALAMGRDDAGGDTKRPILELRPHCYTVDNGDGTVTTDFRTHPKYARVLRHRFALLWRAAHAWDLHVANPLVPALNLGFDSLEVYPDPDPEVTTFDGTTTGGGSSMSWSSLWLHTGAASNDADNPQLIVQLSTALTNPNWYWNIRGAFTFDTTPLRGHPLVSSAVISAKSSTSTGAADPTGISPAVNVVEFSPQSLSGIQTTDHVRYGAVGLATARTFAAIAADGIDVYQDFTLNASGRAQIRGDRPTALGMRESVYDMAGAEPAWGGADQHYWWTTYKAEQSGTTSDPKLAVTYEKSSIFGYYPSPLGRRISF